MRIRFEVLAELTLVYLSFYSHEDCIKLNNGGEIDKTCNLLFDEENEWVGLSIESDYNVQDHFNAGNVFIYRKDSEWQLIFNKDAQVVRREEHGCITDIFDNNFTGIELILLNGVLPKRKYLPIVD